MMSRSWFILMMRCCAELALIWKLLTVLTAAEGCGMMIITATTVCLCVSIAMTSITQPVHVVSA